MSKARQLADLGNVYDDGALSNRNLIINGAMQVAQRGTSSTTDGYSTVDRFTSDIQNGSVTHSQESLSSGDPYDAGFRNFFRLTNTTASSLSSDRRRLYQNIEAQNLANSGWNYISSTSFITVSFWVRTSVAGSYYFAFRTYDGTSQGYVWQETLAANTWTKITKSVSGNSSLAFDNDNGQGFGVIFHQSNGTDFTGGSSLDQWSAYNNTERTPDDTNGWGATTGATYDVTGVKLEVGDKATDFDHISYGDELARCQRYYVFVERGRGSARGSATGASQNAYSHCLPVEMRAVPTCSIYSVGRSGCSFEQFVNLNKQHVGVNVNVTSTSYWFFNDGYTADAEL